jgi:chromosome partitioning protein
MRTNTTLVINPKGGSGKTTVATNLASYFAAQGMVTTLMDYDPQGSSLNWLQVRDPLAPKIHAANGAPQKGLRLRSVGMHVPPNTQQLVIDAPAGASGLLLQELISKSHSILIPVAASAIDIHATANFIATLLLAGNIRARNIRLGVVANKVRKSIPVYQPLERFLASLKLPMLARLPDSDAFLNAAEKGIGVFEMEFAASASERAQFQPIIDWADNLQLVVDGKAPLPAPAGVRPVAPAPVRSGLRVIGSALSSVPSFLRR